MKAMNRRQGMSEGEGTAAGMPRSLAEQIARALRQTQQECREAVGRVDDPRAEALFETVAEVLGGAVNALDHYRGRSEEAWRP